MVEKSTLDVGIYSKAKTIETHCKKGYVLQKKFGFYPSDLGVCGEVVDIFSSLFVDLHSSDENKKYASVLEVLKNFEKYCLNCECNEGVKAAEELEKEARKLIGQKTV